jgi:hypothetical protein
MTYALRRNIALPLGILFAIGVIWNALEWPVCILAWRSGNHSVRSLVILKFNNDIDHLLAGKSIRETEALLNRADDYPNANILSYEFRPSDPLDQAYLQLHFKNNRYVSHEIVGCYMPSPTRVRSD